MKFLVNKASKVVSNTAEVGKTNRDGLKRMKFELDDLRKKCDELEQQVANSKVSRIDKYFKIQSIFYARDIMKGSF